MAAMHGGETAAESAKSAVVEVKIGAGLLGKNEKDAEASIGDYGIIR